MPLPGVTGSAAGRSSRAQVADAERRRSCSRTPSKGYNWNASYEVRRPFRNGFFVSGAYSYGVAKTIMDGTSDQAASNWGNVYVPGDPNNPPLVRVELRSRPPHRRCRAPTTSPLGKDFQATSRCSTRASRAVPTR